MDDDDLRVEDRDIEDLPDDLTPFITRTTLDPVSGGGYGDVWKCDYNADGISAPVAVKAFKFSVDCDSEIIARKIKREIGILKMLRHNNIVALWGRATGFGRRPELDCLVSPWMPNGTLHTYLESKHNNLTVLDRSRLLEDVSAGLRYLHSIPVMHGDITGANILIDRRGHARLIDFGLSAIVRPLLGQSHLAISSIRPGAIRYAAPELVLSDDAHDLPLEKADIYSFGCVMIQVLSSRLPWSEIQLEYRIPVLISQGRGPQRPDGPPSIIDLDWDFIQKCLRHGPELRPSAEEVLDFVIHRLSPLGSSGPLDDPPDDSPDSFPGASPHHGSDASDTRERPPNSLLTPLDQSTCATNSPSSPSVDTPRIFPQNQARYYGDTTSGNHLNYAIPGFFESSPYMGLSDTNITNYETYGEGPSFGNYAAQVPYPDDDVGPFLGGALLSLPSVDRGIPQYGIQSGTAVFHSSSVSPTNSYNPESSSASFVHSVPEHPQDDITMHKGATLATYERPAHLVNDSSESHTDGRIVCQWDDAVSGRCGSTVIVRKDAIMAHLVSYHLKSSMPQNTHVQCSWMGCGRSMRRDTLSRHISEKHFGLRRHTSGRGDMSPRT
ncbi:kinase-like protein [Rhizopogon salebrosus TDB-379]|nr:kinase-like protein [Rhizopogon salebrosus TDB-379]